VIRFDGVVRRWWLCFGASFGPGGGCGLDDVLYPIGGWWLGWVSVLMVVLMMMSLRRYLVWCWDEGKRGRL